MEYSLQLYSVRDFLEFDMDYTFSRLQEFGYKGVEFGSYYNYEPAEIRALLDKYGFKMWGAHIGLVQLDRTFNEYIAFNRALGNNNIIIASAEMYDYDHMRESLELIKKLKPMVEAEGMTLHYHTHDVDHKPNTKTGIIPFDVLVNESDVNLELDTYWEFMAGFDPVEQIKRFRDRVQLIHVKDGDEKKEGRSLGQGIAPVEKVVRYAVETGLPVIVESEGLIPDGISEVKRCSKFLKKLYPPAQ